MYVRMYVYVHVLYVCMYVCLYVCVRMYVRMYKNFIAYDWIYPFPYHTLCTLVKTLKIMDDIV